MADDSQREEPSNHGDGMNERDGMISAIKKLQDDMSILKSENEMLKKELSTVKSKNKSTSRQVVPSVVRRLDYVTDDTQQDGENGPTNDVDEDGNPTKEDTNTGRKTDDERETHREKTNRRSRHKRSKSHGVIPDAIKQELQEMREIIQRIPGVPKPLEKATPTSYADSPFSDNIALVEIPKRFTVPDMKVYDGSTDPQEHVAQYKQRMFTVPITKDLREPCMCKGFGSTLTGPALQWFVGLQNGSIRSFADLVDAFNLQFASSRLFEKTTSDLYRIVQGHREPLREYLTRFNREKVTITYCDIPTAIEAFRKGLVRDSQLYDELTKYPCMTMEDVQAKAMAQVRLEEDKREDDDSYYRPNRKTTTQRPRDYKPEYKPYYRGGRDERHDCNPTQNCRHSTAR